MGGVFYNDNEPFIALWLAELVKDGHLPEGDLENRSIKEIDPAALHDYTHCHFFAGIGGWPLALTLAGWPTDRQVWTMSCPCQPFSAAGKRLGTADSRHLWPDALRLIAECRPATIFGEQVASKDGRLWLAGVRADLEALGYAVGAADLCAAGVGAPHIRQRLFWVAESQGEQHDGRGNAWAGRREFADDSGLGDADDSRPQGRLERRDGGGERSAWQAGVGLALADGWNASAEWQQRSGEHGQQPQDSVACADGKARRVEPGIQPLAHGVPNRVGTLRGAGNAIVHQAAAEFVAAYLDTERQPSVSTQP